MSPGSSLRSKAGADWGLGNDPTHATNAAEIRAFLGRENTIRPWGHMVFEAGEKDKIKFEHILS